MNQEIDQLAEERRKRWKLILEGGFQLLPHVLLKNQANLDLNSNDVLVLLNIMLHWWDPSNHPYPRTSSIVRRMGVDARTVQRSLGKLQELGLVSKTEFYKKGAKRPTAAYDVTGLLLKLEALTLQDTGYMIRSYKKFLNQM